MRRRTKARGPHFIDFEADLGRRLRDPEFRFHFEQRRLIHEVAIAVRSLREQAGLTQARLASMIGSSQPAIARLEKGLDQRTPRWDTLQRIAAALGKQLRLVFARPRGSGPSALVQVERLPRPGAKRSSRRSPHSRVPATSS